MCRCRPTSSTATPPRTCGATRPCLPGTRAPWPRRRRPCISTKRCWPQLDARGIHRASVTLHVGAGTFQPVKTENLAEHRMHSEWYEVPPATQQAIAQARERGGRVVAVGTTTVRTLESWASSGQASGDTSIFITPGFEFRVVDLLITNFHLPRSTLLMLVSAFAGYDRIMSLYRHAIESALSLLQLWRRDAARQTDPCLISNCSRPKATRAAAA